MAKYQVFGAMCGSHNPEADEVTGAEWFSYDFDTLEEALSAAEKIVPTLKPGGRVLVSDHPEGRSFVDILGETYFSHYVEIPD